MAQCGGEMADDCPVVRFSRDSSLARIETPIKQHHDATPATTDSSSTFDAKNFGAFYVICIALSIITYVIDLVLTFVLLYHYYVSLNDYVHNYGLYFALTLTFSLVPALFITTVSLRWYIVDHDDPSLGRTSLLHWIVRIVFLLLQLAPLLRYIDTLIYGIKSKIAAATDNDNQQTTLYRRMLDEDTNGSLLRLFHCFLHAAPQAVIQLVILFTNILRTSSSTSTSSGSSSSVVDGSLVGARLFNIDIAVLQVWAVFTALMSISWSLTSYHRSVRYARDDKDKVKWKGTLVAFCWQFMSALSRVLALSLLASKFPAWMGCVCALHWGVMSVWLALGQQQTAACGSRCEELLLSTALGLAYVIAFISPRDGPTRYVYLVYYLVCFMENTGALVVWCVTNNSSDNPFLYYGAAGMQVFAFILAITFLLVYYKYCHPSTIRRSKIPELSLDSGMLEIDKPGYSKSYNVRGRS